MLAAWVLTAAVGLCTPLATNYDCNQCGNNTGVFACRLCANTTSPLAGDHITWVVGGGAWKLPSGATLTAPACAGANDEPGPGTWVVPGSSTVVSGPENYTLPGKLVLVGPDISILSVTVEKTIELRGDDLSNTVVSDVTIVGGDELVGLRAMRASPTAPLSNLSGCEFTNIVATNSNTSVAITQAYDLPMAVTCLPSSPQVVLQPAVPFTQLDIDASCTEILDLADLLNEFGRLYEISFFNPEARATNGALSSIVRILLVTDAILLIAIFLCFGKPVEAIRKDKDD